MELLDNEVEVYEPAEDTYLLLKAAIAEARSSDRVLEIGCGRGVVSKNLVSRVKEVLATDINPYAVKVTRECGIPTIRADLFRGIKTRFDMVIFNPPYLPTSDEERTTGWMNLALDGGETGRETIKRFLEDLGPHLAPDGRALVLLSSLTGVKEVEEMAVNLGFEVCQAAVERQFFELLHVLKLVPRHGPNS